MGIRIHRIIAATAIYGFVVAQAAAKDARTCDVETVVVRSQAGETAYTVRLADTPETRARGLMYVQNMPANEGMLFVYSEPQTARFWMKNTYIPLDMVFAGRDGTVRHIHEKAVPHDETVIDGGTDVLGVLELNAGEVEKLQLAPGDLLLHPAFTSNYSEDCD